LDDELKWSTSFGLNLGKNREVNYITHENKLQFFKNNNEFVLSFFRSYLELSYRPVIKTKHTFGFRYNVEDVADTILRINPAYNHNQRKINYPEFYYNLSYLNTDFNPYPTKGYVGELSFRKRGISNPINLWQLSAKGSLYKPLIPKYFFNLRAAGVIKLPFKQPYINQQLLGFDGLFMQGYEYFVVDGVTGGYAKAAISRQLINTVFHIPSKRFERLNHIPFRVYAKVYGNTGYVYNPDPGRNELCNRMLYSGGVGLDIITFYDFIIKAGVEF
jgi:outer membrane protein assembly factor BamA